MIGLRAPFVLSLSFAAPLYACAPGTTAVAIGRSMAPYLWNGEALTVQCRRPHRGEMAVFTEGSYAHPLIKWVIAAPGDHFDLIDGTATVNGLTATNSEMRPYRFTGARANTLFDLIGTIPPNAYLVLGNHPHGTDDSSRYGLVSLNQIIGTAKKRVNASIGFVDTAALRHSASDISTDFLYQTIGRIAARHRFNQVVTSGVAHPGDLDLTEEVLEQLVSTHSTQIDPPNRCE